MRTPAFWNRRGLVAWLLWPLSVFYPAIVYLRQKLIKSRRVGVPVICVGSLTAGGAGKTPVALHIGKWCQARGIDAWFVSRGYKGRLSGPVRVNPGSHNAGDVGDEPLLLAQTLPTIVAKDRLAGAEFAARQGAKLIITDDGFQNPALHKDFSLVVVDGENGFGNGFPLPAGPLREWVSLGFKRADAIVFINPEARLTLPENKPMLAAYTRPDEKAQTLHGKKVLAFCGLAIPEKFFATLREIGTDIIQTKIFPDHYTYHEKEIAGLMEQAKNQQAVLVTTSKDAARLPKHLQALVTIVDIHLEFTQPELLDGLLDSVIATP